MKKTCPVCKIALIGRSDKKFCTSDCRSHYHNLINREDRQLFQLINRRLLANRKILYVLQLKNTKRITHLALLKLGFDFDYFTRINHTKSGQKQYFCYDYSYQETSNNNYLIKKQLKVF